VPRSGAGPSFGERLYRRLLRLYPADFRDDYADEMAGLYRDRADAEPLPALWFALAADLVRTAPAEWVAMLMHDLRLAARLLWRTPVFTGSVILTLALGIGANTAIFSVVQAVLLSPLPYPEPERLVQVWTRFANVGLPRDENHVSPPELRDINELGRSFSHTAAYAHTTFNLAASGPPERVEGALASPSLFPLLDVRPVAGRVLTQQESESGRDDVVLIGHGLWQRRFGGDPNIVGRTIRLDARSVTVVGVLPSAFEFPDRTTIEILAPLRLGSEQYDLPTSRGNHWLRVIARLAPGVSIEQARAEMQAVARRMIEGNRGYPYERYNFGIVLTPLFEQTVRDARAILWLLMGTVALVLTVACINITNLLLVRASTRSTEMAVRAALGASRTRLAGQMVIESLLLAACGGATGLLLGAWGTGVLAHLTAGLPRVDDASLNLRVLGFTAIITAATGVLFGVVPALQTARGTSSQRLRAGGRRTTGDRSVHRLRNGLVVAQVALSLVMLVCTGLLTRSLVTLLSIDPGFQPGGVLTMRLSLTGKSYESPERRRMLFEEVFARVRALPGVAAAGAVSDLPLHGAASGTVTIETGRESSSPDVDLLSVTPEYFDAMGIRWVRGRRFDTHDGPRSLPVAIVDETLAETYWPGEDPIGKRLKRGFADSTGPWMSVVGVVGHVRQQTIEASSRVQVYWPYAQNPSTSASVVIRTDGDPNTLATRVREEIAALDPEQPVYDVRTMDAVVSRALAQRRIALALVAALSVLALILAAVGLYGVLSYAVSQRLQEFGIRAALGASPARILFEVVTHGMTVAAAGCVLGLAAALPASRALKHLLYRVDPLDPPTFATVLLVLLSVGLLAAYLPARRAARVSPTAALRYE
jgi:putative ABC transport system permease protein